MDGKNETNDVTTIYVALAACLKLGKPTTNYLANAIFYLTNDMKYGLVLPLSGIEGDIEQLIEYAHIAEEEGWEGGVPGRLHHLYALSRPLSKRTVQDLLPLISPQGDTALAMIR
jgi:hypothetical protein